MMGISYEHYKDGVVEASGECSTKILADIQEAVKNHGLKSFRWMYTGKEFNGRIYYKYTCTREEHNYLRSMFTKLEEPTAQKQDSRLLAIIKRISKCFSFW